MTAIDISLPFPRSKRPRIDDEGQMSSEDWEEYELSQPPALKAVAHGETIVLPGETISAEPGFLRGHGTQLVDGKLVATVAGVIRRVNKLISVQAFKSRYVGEVGDVIVGRITQVQPNMKRWKVDINAKHDATLMLSAINLPGGVQRRRTYEDEMQMRSFFDEGDLISCEVQAQHHDGGIAIHTRNLKYGKLIQGQFISVCPSLIKRQKAHMITLKFGVSIILGMNGYVWIAPIPIPKGDGETASITLETRRLAARVRNAVAMLSQMHHPITQLAIEDIVERSIDGELGASDMLKPSNLSSIISSHEEDEMEY